MVKIIKIPDYESIETILGSYYNEDKIVEEKIRDNLKTLYAREDLSKEERNKLAFECGNGLEFNCYIELSYYKEANEYFFDAESVGATFDDQTEYSSMEGLVQGINNALSKISGCQYGAKIRSLFYTVLSHDEMNLTVGEMLKDLVGLDIVKFFGHPDSRGLTDEEIEKFQNLFKAAAD